MEHFLWATPEASHAVAQDPVRRVKIAEELADVVIYALEFANITGIDVAAAIDYIRRLRMMLIALGILTGGALLFNFLINPFGAWRHHGHGHQRKSERL